MEFDLARGVVDLIPETVERGQPEVFVTCDIDSLIEFDSCLERFSYHHAALADFQSHKQVFAGNRVCVLLRRD